MLRDVVPISKIKSGTKSISASGTEIVDSVSTSSSSGNMWLITMTFGTKVETSTVFGTVKESGVGHTHYGIIGNTISYDLDVIIDGGEMKLSITNNESSEIVVEYNRVAI